VWPWKQYSGKKCITRLSKKFDWTACVVWSLLSPRDRREAVAGSRRRVLHHRSLNLVVYFVGKIWLVIILYEQISGQVEDCNLCPLWLDGAAVCLGCPGETSATLWPIKPADWPSKLFQWLQMRHYDRMRSKKWYKRRPWSLLKQSCFGLVSRDKIYVDRQCYLNSLKGWMLVSIGSWHLFPLKPIICHYIPRTKGLEGRWFGQSLSQSLEEQAERFFTESK